MPSTPEEVAKIAAEKREYIKGRLRRERLHAGLDQGEAAQKIGVSQPALSKIEKEGTASEETLTKLWSLYGLSDSYPSAPKDPERRRAWVDERNAVISRYRPSIKTIGAGKETP